MATKLVLVSLLLLQLAATAFSDKKHINAKHQAHGSHKTVHEPGGPAGGIPAAGTTPHAKPAAARSGKKWCIAKLGPPKSLLRKDFDELCKEVDCSPTGATGMCYDESIKSKASFAMNLKYQKNGQKDSDCVYGGRAEIITTDPSWGKCIMAAN